MSIFLIITGLNKVAQKKKKKKKREYIKKDESSVVNLGYCSTLFGCVCLLNHVVNMIL